MADMQQKMHLGVSVIGVGSHPAAWRLRDEDAPSFSDVRHFNQVAQIAEEGTFDVVLLADVPDEITPEKRPPLSGLEPTVVIASMAAATKRIGFIGTVSTTFNEPYNLARRFASLDHISGGRTSINAVTSYNAKFASHFGVDDLPDHEARYNRAAEFLDVMIGLWDGWEDDAVLADKDTGIHAEMAKIHPLSHRGKYFSVSGALPVPRSPQGRPVITQAGSSEQGRELAARYADIVYSAFVTIEDAQDYCRDLKERARQYGRQDGVPKVLMGIAPVVAGTDEAAWARKAMMDRHLDRSGDLAELASRLGAKVEDLVLDLPLPEHVAAGAQHVEGRSRGMALSLINLAKRENLTVRQLLDKKDKFLPVIGGPGTVADILEQWFRAGATDGFVLNVDVLPGGLKDFVDLVVPELRKRGIFREDYEGETLRDHLGIRAPENIFSVREAAE